MPDPEIAVISVVELGIVRAVAWQGEQLVVTITPTCSGCPATEAIRDAIKQTLLANGMATIEIRTQLAPARTTDWLGESARERLRQYGIAPTARRDLQPSPPEPAPRRGSVVDIRALAEELAPAYPRCGSASRRLISRFGATPCKSAHVYEACLEPFERFKWH